MSTSVDFDDLLAAFEWVASGEVAAVAADAYVGRLTGAIHWRGEGVDEEPPDNIDDGQLYVAVPRKQEFGLGRALVLRFVEAHLPSSFREVSQSFRRPGAYSRFKALLNRNNQLEAWHQYEAAAVEEALDAWCRDNGFVLTRRGRRP